MIPRAPRRRGHPRVLQALIGSDLPQLGQGGSHEISVDRRDAARARELLEAPDFSDEELAQLKRAVAAPRISVARGSR